MKLKVLVVDDEVLVRSVLGRFLTKNGYEPLLAADGYAALDAVRQEKPALILLDLHMPGMDGLETLRRIQMLDERVPVVILTGDVHVSQVKQAIAAGASDYILKPLEYTYLLTYLQAHLNQRLSA